MNFHYLRPKNSQLLRLLVTVTIAVVVNSSSSVLAQTIPAFPTCEIPQGTIIAQYPTGVHGVPGKTSVFTGSDTVYSIDGNRQVLQCFCSLTGEGIETQWLKSSSLLEPDRDSLINMGWIVIPDAAFWGLDQGEYFARNRSYTCAPRGGILASTIQQVGSGSVLGLATTGTTHIAIFLFALSTLFLSLGVSLKPQSH